MGLKTQSFIKRMLFNETIRIGKKFIDLSKKIGLSPAQLGVLWCKDQPGITGVLVGTRKLKHLEDLVKVSEMNLDDEIRNLCDRLVPPGSFVANFYNTSGWMKG